ncbi:MAG: DUF4012 domain-containing protein [Patescibacteria group bacterium]|jgi:hypothetical protein
MNTPKTKKNQTVKNVQYRKSQDDARTVPESNVINLREIVLQKEIERLKNELDRKQRGSIFSGLKKKSAIAPAGTRARAPIVVSQPATSVAAPPKKVRSSWKFSLPRWRIRGYALRSALGFGVVGALLLLFIYGLWGYQSLQDMRDRVAEISIQAFGQLVVAGQAATQSDYTLAKTQFSEATDTFALAQRELNRSGKSILSLLKYVPVKGKLLSSGEHLLLAGQAMSLAGQDLTQMVQMLNPGVTPNQSILDERTVVDLLEQSQEYIEPARDKIKLAAEHVAQVDGAALPEQYRADFARIQSVLPGLAKDMDQFIDFNQVMHQVLGGTGTRRYLLIFQNNREMRPTGGFIGSMALIDVERGAIKKIEIPGGGPYDMQGQLKEKVIAPAPLHLVNPNWYLQDANWFPDWPTSAQKVMWFYEKSGGPTVDGVISLTPEVITNLLKITGSIDMQAKYGVTITSENFIDETLNQVELVYDKTTNKPKQFIADLLPELLNKLLASNQTAFLSVLDSLSQSLDGRQMLMYLNDPTLENQVKNFGWGGDIKSTAGDYLMVVNSNISGGKTDAVIDQTIDHDLEINTDGTATATVEITRTHTGQPGDTWTGVKNVDYLRLYVPQGATLLEATGFEQPDPKLMKSPSREYAPDADLANIEGRVIIDERSGTRINQEFGKTVFGNWAQVEPGQSIKLRLVYRLPINLKPDGVINRAVLYSLYVQKQSGSFNSVYRSTISYPESWAISGVWPDPNAVQADNSTFRIDTVLKGDYVFGTVFEK